MSNILSQSATRIKTGIVLIIVLLIIGFIDSIPLTWLLLGGLMLIALKEAMNLFKINDDKIYLYAVIIWAVAYFYPKPEDLTFVVAIIFASMLAYTKEFNKELFAPLMYPIASYLFLFSLYVSYGMGSLLWLLVIVAGADVGAYFVGKTIGSTKFCETSPNKTLEGVAGGVITAAILGMVFAPEEINFIVAIGISLVVAVASVFGDLFESYLKREADVKDSGNILPGHGGILDRTDGYLFGGIIMLILLRLFT
jgi:phosphatidate cytidylyltransferase